MNKIVLLGRLTKEPEVKITKSEKTVCQFTLAVDRPFSGKDGKKEVDFINIVVWGKTAEACGNYVNKGNRLLVEGRVQTRNYTAKDGTKKYITEVIAEHVEFIERKSDTDNSAGSMGNFGKAQNEKQHIQFDEEIPF